MKRGLVNPFDEGLINPSSIDVKLGSSIYLDTEDGLKFYNISGYTKDKPFRLKPNNFVLACTYEYITLPGNYAAEFKLKSSRARERLGHSLAGWIDNGWEGCLTLELKNYSMFNDVHLYCGLKIGQLIIHETALPENLYESDYKSQLISKPSREDYLKIV